MKQSCLAAFFAAFFACHVQAQETATNTASPAPNDSSLHYLRNLANESDVLPNSDMPEGSIPPSFPGGERALLRFLSENIRYPAQARQNNIQGNVAIHFIVEKNGSLSNITILHNIGGGCAEETARVVATMPKWRPGVVDGETVRVGYCLPARFKLEGPETEFTPGIPNTAQNDSSLHYLRNLAKESGAIPLDAMSAPNLITPPSFPGGEAALLRFLAENIRYPEMARQNNIQGVVTLRFLVKENGSISSITVLRDIGGGCGEEAARVLAVMQNGGRVLQRVGCRPECVTPFRCVLAWKARNNRRKKNGGSGIVCLKID